MSGIVVAVVNQKGGTGKTTLSTNLAAVMAEKARVLLVDADPQGSSLNWAAGDWELPEGLQVVAMEDGRLGEQVRRESADFDWVIVDGPPGMSRVSVDAVRVADLVLIPTKPSPLDVWSAADIVTAVQARQETGDGRPQAAFVISMAQARTRMGRQIETAPIWECRYCGRVPVSGWPTPLRSMRGIRWSMGRINWLAMRFSPYVANWR